VIDSRVGRLGRPAVTVALSLALGAALAPSAARAHEAIPAFLVLTVMPFTYSITNGIGAGFVAFVFLKVLSGRSREVAPLMYLAAAAFLVYFAIA
jgi:xanthine/uracil/vitamin C permease (AzgA family)